jgi:hypothetical protein
MYVYTCAYPHAWIQALAFLVFFYMLLAKKHSIETLECMVYGYRMRPIIQIISRELARCLKVKNKLTELLKHSSAG